jgi:hypothetical protein
LISSDLSGFEDASCPHEKVEPDDEELLDGGDPSCTPPLEPLVGAVVELVGTAILELVPELRAEISSHG